MALPLLTSLVGRARSCGAPPLNGPGTPGTRPARERSESLLRQTGPQRRAGYSLPPGRSRTAGRRRVGPRAASTPTNGHSHTGGPAMSIVFTEDRGSVRHVILNRPEKRNAMNGELLRELGEALRGAAAAEDVHCVVL